MNLHLIGIKTFLIMMTDLLLLTLGGFSGILSALAYDREPWSPAFWMWAMISIGSSFGCAIIGWWCWYELRYKK